MKYGTHKMHARRGRGLMGTLGVPERKKEGWEKKDIDPS